mmetsp:Transcript_26852/g.45772  ORF Transcript_26852/g.45772 Transcript_26852/m.45772 type:complete len:80 (-) Transcript_26852:761-1000(-)
MELSGRTCGKCLPLFSDVTEEHVTVTPRRDTVSAMLAANPYDAPCLKLASEQTMPASVQAEVQLSPGSERRRKSPGSAS